MKSSSEYFRIFLSVIFDREMKEYKTLDLTKLNGLTKPSIEVKTDKCLRYSALDVENVTVKKSPMLMSKYYLK